MHDVIDRDAEVPGTRTRLPGLLATTLVAVTVAVLAAGCATPTRTLGLAEDEMVAVASAPVDDSTPAATDFGPEPDTDPDPAPGADPGIDLGPECLDTTSCADLLDDWLADQEVLAAGGEPSDDPLAEPSTDPTSVDEPSTERATRPTQDVRGQAPPQPEDPAGDEEGDAVDEELAGLDEDALVDDGSPEDFDAALDAAVEDAEAALAQLDDPFENGDERATTEAAASPAAPGASGPGSWVGIVTDTAPVGPRLSTRVDIQAGGTAAGARVDVLGEGLAPGSTVTATVSSGPVLLGRTLVNEQGLASLTAQVPDDLGPGQHVVDVRATGADGSPVQSIGAFTIDDSGIVQAVAPMGELLEPVAPDDPILARALQARAAVFDPQRYPAVTASTALLSIAVAGILGVGGVAATMAGTSLPTPGRAADPLAAPLPPVTRRRAKLAGASMQPLRGTAEDEPGPGDRSRSWQWPGTAAVEAALSRAAARLARITDAGPRILADGAWCRAMLGSLALALWLAGAAVGVGAAASVDFALRPPAAPWLVAIVAIGVLDAAAGLAAWLALALGALVTGQVTSWDDVRTAFGIFALYTLVPVIANALRPLRRRVDHTAKARFDRLADYVAMPVLVAWAGSAMVLALNGLSGLELVDEPLVGLLRWTIAIALLARLILEDAATYAYPQRLAAVGPPQVPPRSLPVGLTSVALRVAVFVFVAAPFVGLGAATFVAAGLTAIPMVLFESRDRLGNVPWLHRLLPRGMSRRLLLLVTGLYLTGWLLGSSAGAPSPETLNWLLVPGIVVASIAAFARAGGVWPDGWGKRWVGTLVWLALAGLTTGLLVLPLP